MTSGQTVTSPELPEFSRDFLQSGRRLLRIGTGQIGGKAQGLVFIRDMLESTFEADSAPQVTVGIPTLVVIATDMFDAFMDRNDLY
ncbi:MAG: hypothetical protein PVF27_00005, partial [Gemmatimonadales bacterium]